MHAESVSFVRSTVTVDSGKLVVRGGSGQVSLTLSAETPKDSGSESFLQKLTLGMSADEAIDIGNQLIAAAKAK